MTTVAFDGRYMVSEGRSTTGDGFICGREEQKVFPLTITLGGEETEVVVGISGNAITIQSFVRFLESGGDMLDRESGFSLFSDHPDPEHASIGVIMVTRAGEVSLISESLVPFPAEFPLSAGSGTPFATTAMSCGMNAVQAVLKAIEFDVYSGGKLRAFDTETWAWAEVGDLR